MEVRRRMTTGIHHITAIASDAKKTFEFYSKILGLRLVKKTVNQDDVQTYHLFFGDRLGHPGMDLTFFIFLPSMKGSPGNGMVTTISLAVPEESLTFWETRLEEYKVEHDITERFGKKRIVFYDGDHQQLELVGVPPTELSKNPNLWTTTEISESEAVRCFYSATLSVESLTTLEPILKHVFGYEILQAEDQQTLFGVKDSDRANLLEVEVNANREYGLNAAGTVHHIAFRAKDHQQQLKMREKVIALGLHPTLEIERFYFKSVYFRIPDGILFEIATDGPGFTADESPETLGDKLALPPFLESQRRAIEHNLPELKTN